jgi:hypothetical protein
MNEVFSRLAVSILRFVDDHQPGFVECAMTDASGEVHLFLEKVPVVTTMNLTATSRYPVEGVIACEVEATWLDEELRSLCRINTKWPWGVESTRGQTSFVVLWSQMRVHA